MQTEIANSDRRIHYVKSKGSIPQHEYNHEIQFYCKAPKIMLKNERAHSVIHAAKEEQKETTDEGVESGFNIYTMLHQKKLSQAKHSNAHRLIMQQYNMEKDKAKEEGVSLMEASNQKNLKPLEHILKSLGDKSKYAFKNGMVNINQIMETHIKKIEGKLFPVTKKVELEKNMSSDIIKRKETIHFKKIERYVNKSSKQAGEKTFQLSGPPISDILHAYFNSNNNDLNLMENYKRQQANFNAKKMLSKETLMKMLDKQNHERPYVLQYKKKMLYDMLMNSHFTTYQLLQVLRAETELKSMQLLQNVISKYGPIYYDIIQKVFNRKIDINKTSALPIDFIKSLIESAKLPTKDLIFEFIGCLPIEQLKESGHLRQMKKYAFN